MIMIEDWIIEEKSVIIDALTGLEVSPGDILEKIRNDEDKKL